MMAIRAAAALLIAAGAAGTGLASPQQGLTLRVCSADHAFPPFTQLDGSGTIQRQTRRIARQFSLHVDNYYAPRRRCLQDIASGRADATFASYSTERAATMVFPMAGPGTPRRAQALNEATYTVYRRRGDTGLLWDGQRFAAAAGGAVGIVRGYDYGSKLAQAGLPIDDGAADAAQALRKLAAGRLAAAIVNEGEVQHLLAKQPGFARRIEPLQPPFALIPIYLAFSRDFVAARGDLSQRLWRAIEADHARDVERKR